jgi:23S rRNA (cytidine1920-2'-O)/16S rRNA (cytidine1409-2'-O)-methyltransferase
MRQRLDALLVARGLARSRSRAAALIRAGKVTVDGDPVTRPATSVAADAALTVDDAGWVSRAAYKLLGALDDLEVTVPARVLDAGASTGGFTQVVLSRGAERVYAVDVGTDQLALELRSDPRVVVHEQTNVRDLTLADVDGQPVDLVVADVSFISLRLLLAPLLGVLEDHGTALLMVKPQFEVGREHLGKGGVVRDPALRACVVDAVVRAAEHHGWGCAGRAESRLPGPAGNVEYFVHLRPAHLC